MAITTWENLPKNPLDPTVISQAIDEAIDAHELDPEAHLGEGESLQSHRASEIIDHRAESVVNDKIAVLPRRYIAIVDPESESDFATINDAVNYAAARGGGDILIARGTHYIEESVVLPGTVSLQGMGAGETIIEADFNHDGVFEISETILPEGFFVSGVQANTGTSNLTIPGVENANNPLLIGCFVTFYNGVSQIKRRITARVSDNLYTVEGGPYTTGSTYNGTIRPGVYLENGSNVAQSTWNGEASANGIAPGYHMIAGTAGDVGMIVSSDENGQALLADTFTGTTGYYEVYSTLVEPTMAYVNGITFRCQGGYSVFFNEGELCGIVAEDCEFDCPEVISGINYLPFKALRCNFFLYEDTYLAASEMDTFNDCEFNNRYSRTTNYTSGYNTIFNNCRLYGGGSWPWNALAPLNQGALFSNCVIYGQRTAALQSPSGASTHSRGSISNSRIGLETSAALSISGRGYIVNGNYFYGSTAALTLATGSQMNILTNNLHDGTFTNSGTNNVMANNQTY